MTARASIWRPALLAAWAAFALYAGWGTATVPFHPDEATYLYMSRDFDLLFRPGLPDSVSWQAPGQPALVRRYRQLDAPLGRYLAGLGRALAGQASLSQDWNWSATWAENEAAGAVPAARTLAAARLPATALTVLSCGLMYALSHRLGGRPTGLTAAILYALSGLVLLHGRRAMSEGPQLFFTVLTLWLLLRPRPRLVLAALALAAAVAAKLTALTLLPVALLALWPAAGDGGKPTQAPARTALRQLVVFGGALVLGLWALHPALWAAPIAGLQAMQAARQVFLAEQAAFVQAIAPHVLLAQPGLRALALLYHVYFAPLAYADVGQYAAATALTEQRYAAVFVNTGWHTGSLGLNFVLGGLLLVLTLVGLFSAVRLVAADQRGHAPQPSQGPFNLSSWRGYLLLAVWTIATAAGLLAIAVPAQRYYMPLVPIACLWAALGLRALLQPLFLRWQLARQPQAEA